MEAAHGCRSTGPPKDTKNQTDAPADPTGPIDSPVGAHAETPAKSQCFVGNNYSTSFRGNECSNVKDDLHKTSSFSKKNINNEVDERSNSQASTDHTSSVPTLHLLPNSLKTKRNHWRSLSDASSSPSDNTSETTEQTAHTELSASPTSEAAPARPTFIPVYQKAKVSVATAPLASPSPQPVEAGVSHSPISPRQSSRKCHSKRPIKSPKPTRLPVRSPPSSPRSPNSQGGEASGRFFSRESPIIEEATTDSDSDGNLPPSRRLKKSAVVWSNHNYNKEVV